MALATLSIDLTARMATLERDMGRAAQIAQKNADRMQKAFDGVGRAVGGLGALLGAGSFGLWIRGAVDAAAQVERLSQLSGAGAVEFQRYAAGSKSVGIETDKLADIFKDVNDKVGEFILTGGGELKDFFEVIAPKVGVTAEQFRNLSGPQALQLYFNSLQKANVSQAEMTFFMEAIADEASALAPLLANNGAKFKDLADEAERLGGIYSEQLVKESKAFNDNMDKLQVLSNAAAIQIGSSLVPAINEMIEEMVEGIRIAGGFAEAMNLFGLKLDPFKGLGENLKTVRKQIEDTEAALARMNASGKAYDFGPRETLLRGDAEKRLSDLRKQKEFLEVQQRSAALDGSDNRDPRDRFAASATTPAGTFRPPKPADKPKKSARTKADDLLGDFAKDADERLKPYFDAMQKFEQIQLDAAASTADLTQSERAFFDLINAPEWQAMSAPLQDKIRASFEAANATERMTESEKRLRQLLSDPVLERQREDMRLLTDEFLRGGISAEKYSDDVRRALGNVAEPVKTAKDEFADLKRAIEGWGQDSAQAIVDFAITGKSSFSDMIESMLADLAKMAIYQNVTGPMFQKAAEFDWSKLFTKNALGGIYTSPSLSAYSNQIHDSPKFFQFANGGVFAEAGPEAIMPLSRDSRGRLGVKAEGGGGFSLENLRIEIKNEGRPQEVASAQPRFDAESLVVGVVLRDLRSNGPIRQALG